MLISKNVNNDVSKDSPILYRLTVRRINYFIAQCDWFTMLMKTNHFIVMFQLYPACLKPFTDELKSTRKGEIFASLREILS